MHLICGKLKFCSKYHCTGIYKDIGCLFFEEKNSNFKNFARITFKPLSVQEFHNFISENIKLFELNVEPVA